jgi:hypothetical protein
VGLLTKKQMGKKKHLKVLRIFASRLPKTYEVKLRTRYLKAYELPEDEFNKIFPRGIDQRTGERVEPDTLLNQKVHKMIKINNYRRLKKEFWKDGELGLVRYAKWVNNNNIRLNKLYKDHKLEEVSPGIMRLVEDGPKGFIRRFLIFLKAFLISFQDMFTQSATQENEDDDELTVSSEYSVVNQGSKRISEEEE